MLCLCDAVQRIETTVVSYAWCSHTVQQEQHCTNNGEDSHILRRDASRALCGRSIIFAALLMLEICVFACDFGSNFILRIINAFHSLKENLAFFAHKMFTRC